MNDADIDRRLRAADCAHAIDGGTLDALAVAAQREGRTSRRRRLTAIGLSALVVIGGGAVAAPAAADAVRQFLAQSDWFPAAGGEILPDSEWIDTGQPDLRAYLDTVSTDGVELAPGEDRDALLDAVAESHAANPGLTQEVGLRRSIEVRAYCGWAVELIDAQRVGDDAGYDRAAAVVLGAAEWPALLATDGGGITDRLRDVGQAAVDREPGSWLTVYEVGECDLLGYSAVTE